MKKIILLIIALIINIYSQDSVIVDGYYTGAAIKAALDKAGTAVQPGTLSGYVPYSATTNWDKNAADDTLGGAGSNHNWRYPADYGAVGDGVTNDYQALRACFKTWGYENSGEEEYLDTLFIKLEAGKTYRVDVGGNTNPVFYWEAEPAQNLKYLYIDGQGSTIYLDTISSGAVFNITGFGDSGDHLVGWVSIPSTILRGSDTIQVTSGIASTAKRGQILWLSTSSQVGGIEIQAPWISNSEPMGEFVEVLDVVAGNKLVLYEPTRETYPANDTTKMKLFTVPEVVIKNINIKSIPNPNVGSRYSIAMTAVRKALIQNVETIGFEYLVYSAYQCINTVWDNVVATDFSDRADLGHNYGIVISGGQNHLITNCRLQGGRHGVDFAAANGLLGYNMVLENSIIGNKNKTSNSTVSSHPGVRDISILGNTIYGTIGMRSSFNTIRDNTLICWVRGNEGEGGTGIGISGSWSPKTYPGIVYNDIIGNYVEGYRTAFTVYTGNEGGTRVSANIRNNTAYTDAFLLVDIQNNSNEKQWVDNLIVSDNHWKGFGSNSDSYSVALNPAAWDTVHIKNLIFENNVIENTRQGFYCYGKVSDTTALIIDKFIIRNNTFGTLQLLYSVDEVVFNYLDITNNILDTELYSGNQNAYKIVDINANATVTWLKHMFNTYMNLESGAGEIVVEVTPTVTNWYHGGDILTVPTGWTMFSVTATSGFNINWIAD